MTGFDPSPVVTSRRDVLEQLDDLRERVARFLDHPSAEGFHLLSEGAQQFLRFEAEEVLPDVRRSDVPHDRVDALVDGHEALGARLDRMTWAVPGSSDIQSEAHRLRHELLAQVDRYNALRLPRGSLTAGT